MSKARVRRLTITDAVNQYRARVRRLKITGANATRKARVRGLTISGQGPSQRARVRSLKIIGGTLGSLLADAGGGRYADPMTTVTLDGTNSSGPPETYSWVQVANGAPTVTLVGSGAVVGFVAPAHINGADLVFELTVTKGAATDTDLASITVYPQTRWVLNEAETTWLPQVRYNL